MTPVHTEILFILDRSGSMEAMRHAAIDGFNRFLADQQAAPDSARLSLLLFDDRLELPLESVPLAEILPINEDGFVPRGSTALLDAVGTGIDELGRRLAAMPEAQRPTSICVAILTDGEENSSRRYTWAQVADRIAHQQEKYGWEFFFLGAGPDAIASAAKLHIHQRNSADYLADAAGLGSAKAALSKKILSSRAIKHGYATDEDRRTHARSTKEILEEEDRQRRPDAGA